MLLTTVLLISTTLTPTTTPADAPDRLSWCVSTPTHEECGDGPLEVRLCLGSYCAGCSSDGGLLRCSLSTPTHECNVSCGNAPGSCGGSCEAVG